jgi:hypothetical protein
MYDALVRQAVIEPMLLCAVFSSQWIQLNVVLKPRFGREAAPDGSLFVPIQLIGDIFISAM